MMVTEHFQDNSCGPGWTGYLTSLRKAGKDTVVATYLQFHFPWFQYQDQLKILNERFQK